MESSKGRTYERLRFSSHDCVSAASGRHATQSMSSVLVRGAEKFPKCSIVLLIGSAFDINDSVNVLV